MMIGRADIKIVLRDTGQVLRWASLMFLVPILYCLLFEFEPGLLLAFATPMALCFGLGTLLKRLFDIKLDTKMVDALVSIVLIWVLMCAIAGMPFYMGMDKPIEDAVFAGASALTTTGLDIFWGAPGASLDQTPNSLLLWFHLLSWVGGAGLVIIVSLGVIGAMHRATRLYSAEHGKELIKPNVVHTVRLIWMTYALLTAVGTLLLLLAGMEPFDAVNYAMSAISTTGLGMTTLGLEVAHSPAIDVAIIVTMLLGAVPFVAHYAFLTKDRLAYFRDKQVFVLLFLIVLGVAFVVPKLAATYGPNAVMVGLMQVTSAATSGGFNTVDLSQWVGQFDEVVWALIVLMFIGGSAGSTAGGIKLLRFSVLMKSLWWKTRRIVLPPHAVFTKRVGGHEIADEEINTIQAVFVLYLLFAVIGSLVLMYHGYGATESIFEVVSAQSNVGLTVGVTHYSAPLLVKLTLMFHMIAGRLEIIPLLGVLGFLLKVRL